MSDATQIRELAYEYLSKKMKAKSFIEKFALISHSIHQSDDPEAIQLCDQIESLFVLRITNDVAEKEFRDELVRRLTVTRISEENKAEHPSPFVQSEHSYSLPYEPVRMVLT